jgi:hypothetical protein
MKVLKKADTSNWSHKFKCSSCESELEAESSDLLYTYCSGYGREPDYEYYSVKCAVCDAAHNVKTADIPQLLQLQVNLNNQSMKN